MADAASAVQGKKKQGLKNKAREQRKSLRSAAPTAIPAAMRSAIPAGNGQALNPVIAAHMGDRFGVDFSRVRVHDNAHAHNAASAAGAKAYTVGNHVVFNDQRYQPSTDGGRRLLAHELAHVIQQSRGGASPDPAHPDANLENAAQTAAGHVAAGQDVPQVAGASGVGVACEPDTDVATAKQRIVKAMGELQKLEGAVADGKKSGRSITAADSIRALDAITLARNAARVSKDPTFISVADGLIDKFDAATQGTPAARPSSFDQHPAASTTPMTAEEGNRAVTAQRGFSAALGAGKLNDARAELDLLETAAKAAGSEQERAEFRKKIDALKRRIAISTPTLKRTEELTQQKSILEKQLARETKPVEKQKLQQQIASFQRQIDAVKAATADPNTRPALPAMQGGRLGHSGSTFVTIQIVGADGKLITTVQAQNDPTRHAEVVILERLEALPGKDKFKGATMIVSGDQEVCKKCTPAVAQFAKKYNFKEAYGETVHAPQITSAGKLNDKDATAKTTVGKVADPSAVEKLEQAQRNAGQIGPEDKVKQKFKRFSIYRDESQGPPASSATTMKSSAPPQAQPASSASQPKVATATKPSATAGAPPKQPLDLTKPATSPQTTAPPKATGMMPPAKVQPPSKPPVVPTVQPPKPNTAAMRAPRLSGLKNYGRGVAGAGGKAAIGFLAEVIAAKFRQDQMEQLINEMIPPLVEAGMAKSSDGLYRKQIEKPGETLYWNVTIEISTYTEQMRGTGNLNPEVTAVELSWENKNSKKDSVKAGIGHAFSTTTVIYSFPAEELPFDDLMQYAASQNMSMDALREYAKKQIAEIETPDANTTVDPRQVQLLRTRWANKLQSLEEYDLGVKQRKSEQARKQKEAEDKLNREKLDRMQVADKEKASRKPPTDVPGLIPPGQSPASSAPLKIGPFDALPEVSQGERGNLIAFKYEQEKETWVATSKEILRLYDARELSDELLQRFRKRRDGWMASLNRYAEAMDKNPEMKSGASRMKELQNWLVNDGHNALLIGL